MKKVLCEVTLKVAIPLVVDVLRPFAEDARGKILIHGAKFFLAMRDFSEDMRLECLKHGTR
jgi:hypothetical protein